MRLSVSVLLTGIAVGVIRGVRIAVSRSVTMSQLIGLMSFAGAIEKNQRERRHQRHGAEKGAHPRHDTHLL